MASNLLTPKTKKKNDNFLLSFNTFAQTHGVNTKDEEEEERKRQEQEQQRQTYTQRQQQIKRGNAIDQILGAEQERKRKNTMASAYKPMEYTQQQKDYMDVLWAKNHEADPLNNQSGYIRQMNTVRNNGLYTGNSLNMMNRKQLEQERRIREERYNTELGKQEAWQNRTEEDKKKELEEEQQANERVARLNALTEYGIQYREGDNGDPYLVGRNEWGLGSNQYLKTRPQDYGWDTSEDVLYDRMLYDSIYGKGEYDKRKEQRQTQQDYDDFDEEISGLWDKLESGSWDDMMQAQQERNEKERENVGVFKTEQYKNELQDVDDALARWDRAAELEQNRPQDVSGDYDRDKVNWSIFGSKTDQIYYYANMDLTQDDVSDFRRYGNMRTEQFMTPEQRDTFNAYYNSGDKESAQAYYEALQHCLREMELQTKSELEKKMSQNGYAPLMIGTRIATKPVEGVVGTGAAIAAAAGNLEALNPNSQVWDMTRTNRNIQNARADAWGKQAAEWFGGGDEGTAAFVARMLNGVVYSMADNIVATGLGAGTGAAGKLAEGAVHCSFSQN